MRIGELAKTTGIGIDAIRFYERHGLLPEPKRRESGYRTYAVDDVHLLQFIARAKQLGFSLQEIRELLELSNARETDVASVKAATEKAKGTVTHVELGDNDNQQVVWDVDVVDKENWNKTSVEVDAANGKVLGQKVDKD